MATVKKTQFEEATSEIGFQAQETAVFLRSKRLVSISLILLDMMIPFQKQISAALSVMHPMASLIFGQKAAEKIVTFSNGENSFSALKEALERGEK